MPRPLPPLLALAAGAVAAFALVACGGEDAKLLPGETAREIIANLDTVRQLSNEGDCMGAESAAAQVGEQIEAIEGVDRKLKQALEGGAARLEEVIAECEESSSEAIAPAEIPPATEENEKRGREKGSKGKEAKPAEEDEAEATTPSPPQSNGEGNNPESGNESPAGEEAPEEGGGEAPSGGVSPGAPAGEGE